VARHCVARDIRIPGLRRVVMAGSPVPGHVHEMLLRRILDEGAETYTPYGATESLPVANFRGSEMLAETWSQTRAGRGMCVGRPLPEVTLRIIKISDEAIARWDEALVLPQGGIGEICVKGPVVTREYFRRPEATALAKIAEGDAVWHRIGDVGYVDEQGRLWFCGRKTQRVETAQGPLYTEQVEPVFNTVAGVRRTALVGIGPAGAQRPVLCYELEPGVKDAPAILAALRTVAGAHPPLAGIADFLCHRAFPVDIRHNAKIGREKLAVWATAQLEQHA
jgi:acyl-CoA synthetase (AMP-forming)/AMP-acid ligase II